VSAVSSGSVFSSYSAFSSGSAFSILIMKKKVGDIESSPELLDNIATSSRSKPSAKFVPGESLSVSIIWQQDRRRMQLEGNRVGIRTAVGNVVNHLKGFQIHASDPLEWLIEIKDRVEAIAIGIRIGRICRIKIDNFFV
jgi:hypothetical protein